jgi:hypothetical protein
MITTIEKIEKGIITLAEFSKDQQSFIRGIVKLSYNEGLEKGQTLPLDSVVLQSEPLINIHGYVGELNGNCRKCGLPEGCH